MAVFYRDAPHFQVKALQQNITNVLGFQVAPGGRLWFILGCYLPPDEAVIIKCVIAAIGQRPRGAALLVARYFNTNLAAPEGSNHREDITASVATDGLEDMSAHFLLHCKPWT